MERREWLGGSRLSLAAGIPESLAAHLSAGLAMRAAGLGERFYGFSPSPGGYQVGNPGLQAERSWRGEAGLQLKRSWLAATLRAHTSLVQHFILPTVIDQRDVNGDGSLDTIQGFVNVDALLLGAELSVQLRPCRWLSLPVSAAWVQGTNLDDDRPLPLIPPLEARLAVRFEAGHERRTWLELGGRVTAAQERVDELLPEDSTPAFATLRAELGAALGKQLSLSLAVENLLDTTYHEHLTREALLGTDDLAAGDEIPAPGRSLLVQLRGAL